MTREQFSWIEAGPLWEETIDGALYLAPTDRVSCQKSLSKPSEGRGWPQSPTRTGISSSSILTR